MKSNPICDVEEARSILVASRLHLHIPAGFSLSSVFLDGVLRAIKITSLQSECKHFVPVEPPVCCLRSPAKVSVAINGGGVGFIKELTIVSSKSK